MPTIHQTFSLPLLAWFDKHGRKDLPWQHPRSAYRVWISEIMLQQTQVKTVIPYFLRFMERFANVTSLANAAEDEVLSFWSGLGYYSRARNLHFAAKIILTDYQGNVPDELQTLLTLPGIGESTAAAITSLAFNKPTAILDGNVKRVLSRYFMIEGLSSQARIKEKFWNKAHECMPSDRCTDYTQAIMDLGATCCTPKNPLCDTCPVQTSCLANKHGVADQFPHKKPKKILPIKEEQFLVLHTELNLIYLEKRPPTGLWGGLWCLPTTNIETCVTSHVSETYQLQCERPQELLKIKHSFSHFHLHILAVSVQTKAKASTQSIAECPGRWFHANELRNLGLAKPVSMIIDRFLSVGTCAE